MVKKRKRIRKPKPTKICTVSNGEITYSKKQYENTTLKPKETMVR